MAVSIDARLNGVMREVELADGYLYQATDKDLENRITSSLLMAQANEQAIRALIQRHLQAYKQKTLAMSQFFTSWLKTQF